jgi:hypothetical protein
MDHGDTRMVHSWTEVYTRCMDGELFRGEYCPRDGHSNDTSTWVARAAEELRAERRAITLAELRRRGFDGDLAGVIVVEFADEALAPEWLRPNR